MFDFDEIEEVAPAARDAAAKAQAAKPVAVREDRERRLPGASYERLLSPEDEKVFERSEQGKLRWLAAGDECMARRAEVAGLRSAVASQKERARDAWYDLQPEEAVRIKARLGEIEEELQEALEALTLAEESEERCAAEARAAQKEASALQKAREAEADALVLGRLRRAPLSGAPAVQSPWLPLGAALGNARVRLFAFLGAGQQVQDFTNWPEVARRAYPMVSLCFVQAPEQAWAAAEKDPRGSVHGLAEAFVESSLDPLLADGRPFALLGCCSGARLAYEVARRRAPARLYVAGRGAPHCGARGQPREEPCDPVAPEQPGSAMLARLCAADQGWGEETLGSARALRDLEVGWSPLAEGDSQGFALPTRLSCRVRVYEAEGDAVWPPATVRMGWNLYAPTPGSRCVKKSYRGLSHSDLCSPSGAPLLVDVLSDLRQLLDSAA